MRGKLIPPHPRTIFKTHHSLFLTLTYYSVFNITSILGIDAFKFLEKFSAFKIKIKNVQVDALKILKTKCFTINVKKNYKNNFFKF